MGAAARIEPENPGTGGEFYRSEQKASNFLLETRFTARTTWLRHNTRRTIDVHSCCQKHMWPWRYAAWQVLCYESCHRLPCCNCFTGFACWGCFQCYHLLSREKMMMLLKTVFVFARSPIQEICVTAKIGPRDSRRVPQCRAKGYLSWFRLENCFTARIYCNIASQLVYHYFH